MFKIDYLLGNHGWARVTLHVGDVVESSPVSYIGAPLHELALTAIRVVDPTAMESLHSYRVGTIVFAGEPDGLVLDVTDGVSGSFSFRHYETKGPNGTVFNPPPARERTVIVTLSYSDNSDDEKPDKEVRATETISAFEFGMAAHRVLSKVLDEAGVQGYFDRWMAYFPLAEYAHLGRVLSLPSETIALW